MINIIKEKLEIDETLKRRLEIICDFCNTTPKNINGSIRKVHKINISYIEPHRIIIKNNTFLVFNYSNEVYINNLSKKIKLTELKNYLKTMTIDKSFVLKLDRLTRSVMDWEKILLLFLTMLEMK